MKLSFKANLRLGLGLSLLLLLISSVASYVSIRQQIKNTHLVTRSQRTINVFDNMLSVLKDAETGQRGYLLTKNEVFLQPYLRSKKKINDLATKAFDAAKGNTTYTAYLNQLQKTIDIRLGILEQSIILKKRGGMVTESDLVKGKKYMDEVRILVSKMKAEEAKLLASSTEKMKSLTKFTPLLILVSAILSILITLFFYSKVSAYFNEKNLIYSQLDALNKDITKRITTIEGIARQISDGNYQIRLDETEKDSLGSLAGSLNTMAKSLAQSFESIEDREWLQAGIATISEKMVGEKGIIQLTEDVLAAIVEHTGSVVGAFYLVEEDHLLHFKSGYAFAASRYNNKFAPGQGLIGQALKSGKLMLLQNISDSQAIITYASGQAKPTNVVAFPIQREGTTVGVIELASLDAYTNQEIELLNSIGQNIGIAIHGAQNRKKLQEFLEETQAQAEELQAQHGELENLNAELEAQTQKLQASEEELKVQQEELLQSNQELEERSSILEEKNQLIQERNQEIQHKAEELEQSTRYKSEFLANMSHELRTPLNSILLLSRLMADSEELGSEYTEYAQVIQSSGQGLLNLIDEILDLSKIEAGKMDLEITDISVQEMVKGLEALFSPIAKHKNLQLQISVHKNVPEQIITDRMRLEQIIKNLISNALKFTSAGKITLNITANNKAISFAVADTGIGIPQEKQAMVFEAFQQADGSTKRKFGGTGLGLSISRELAKLLGGTISLQSKENQGSEFTLKIPLNYTDKEDDFLAEQQSEKKLEIEKAEKPVKTFVVDRIPGEVNDDRDHILPGDKVVLIIEDDTPFAKTLLDFTRKRNYKGIVAVRGDQGIDMAKRYSPLAILLDIQLPVKDGWQVMDELKSDPNTRPIPVHIMSSMQVKKESLLKGAVDFINKPFAFEQMKQVFEKLEYALSRSPKKVLIVEENKQHAKALSYFLSNANIVAKVAGNINESIDALTQNEIDCVILDMGVPDNNAYEALEIIKEKEGLENLPIIVFTGKSLSQGEERRIKQYADTIVVKTAHSYQRILDEAGLFLHLVEEKGKTQTSSRANTDIAALANVLKDKTVLIADDDVRNIFSLSKALEQHKMNILPATDGKEALRVLAENPEVDIILMDMMMPELDGYETTRAIRSINAYKNTPILAVTAKAMMGDREKCITAGASDYISKPVDVDQLVSLLRVWLYDKN